jgi:hypothetical protein
MSNRPQDEHPELMPVALMPYGAVAQLPADATKERRISMHFRLPFLTKWGQSVVVTGTGARVCVWGGYRQQQFVAAVL